MNESLSDKSQPIKAVIFDCDGTLVDSEDVQFLSWQYAFENQGYDLDKQTYIQFVGIGHANVL